ncbi:hypothetical protein J2X36_005458 [Methylobacterium sp. BE186]|uniref:hypothetical protein n=1 Tax=Methylobacterium sp. BE186 TaxID=2817715 RepID=UPI00285D750E|nr:hypothetical protein [Methylobacterium sp. BE186]MDR7040671.1 hypothetical protein [Methylobacterium sp. BE186]
MHKIRSNVEADEFAFLLGGTRSRASAADCILHIFDLRRIELRSIRDLGRISDNYHCGTAFSSVFTRTSASLPGSLDDSLPEMDESDSILHVHFPSASINCAAKKLLYSAIWHSCPRDNLGVLLAILYVISLAPR